MELPKTPKNGGLPQDFSRKTLVSRVRLVRAIWLDLDRGSESTRGTGRNNVRLIILRPFKRYQGEFHHSFREFRAYFNTL